MSDNQLHVDTSSYGGQQHLRNASAHSDAANTLTSPMSKDVLEGGESGEFKYPERLDQYEFRGSLYKKRGGWGKHLGWRLRAFTLYQGAPNTPAPLYIICTRICRYGGAQGGRCTHSDVESRAWLAPERPNVHLSRLFQGTCVITRRSSCTRTWTVSSHAVC